MKARKVECCQVLREARGISKEQAEEFVSGLDEHEIHAITDSIDTPQRGEALRQILDAIADRRIAEAQEQIAPSGGEVTREIEPHASPQLDLAGESEPPIED